VYTSWGKPNDIDKSVGDSIRLCLNIMDKKVNALDMKGE
jgi:dihydroflavonol-4-reductase